MADNSITSKKLTLLPLEFTLQDKWASMHAVRAIPTEHLVKIILQ